MKRSEKLLDAIGQIDDRLVEDAIRAGQDLTEKERSSDAALVLPAGKVSADENGKVRIEESAKADRRKSGKTRKNRRKMKGAAIYRWQGALAACAVVAVCAGIFGLLNRNGLLLSPYDSGSTASGSAEIAMDAAGELDAVPERMEGAEDEIAGAALAQNEAAAGQNADELENAPEAFAADAPEKQDAAQARNSAGEEAGEALSEEAGISAQSADEGLMAQAEDANEELEAAAEQKSAASDSITAFVRENTTDSVQLVIVNGGETKLLFGQAYGVEQMAEDGSWQALSMAVQGNVGWEDVEYSVNPQETWEETLAVGSLYGTLKPGQYRIVKHYKTEGDEQEKALYAAFTVAE